MMKRILINLFLFVCLSVGAQGIPTLETGGQPMPDEWIDQDTYFDL